MKRYFYMRTKIINVLVIMIIKNYVLNELNDDKIIKNYGIASNKKNHEF